MSAETERKTLEQRLRTVGLQMKATSLGTRMEQTSLRAYRVHDWRCTITRPGRHTRMTVSRFTMGEAYGDRQPTLMEVLECLLSDASGVENTGSFEEWAREYGYEEDSRAAEKTYRAVVGQTERLKRLLDTDYEAFLWETDRE